MKHWQKCVLIVAVLLLSPGSAHAYLGPGVGIGAILLTLAVGAGIVFLLIGLVWYPLKRLFTASKIRDPE